MRDPGNLDETVSGVRDGGAQPSAAFTAAQLKILKDAVWALDHAARLRGNIRVFDGRKWPAINKLKLAGLLTVEDYDGRSHHDVITLRATEEARAVFAKALIAQAADTSARNVPAREGQEQEPSSSNASPSPPVAARHGSDANAEPSGKED